jgi:hypothetical protein
MQAVSGMKVKKTTARLSFDSLLITWIHKAGTGRTQAALAECLV